MYARDQFPPSTSIATSHGASRSRLASRPLRNHSFCKHHLCTADISRNLRPISVSKMSTYITAFASGPLSCIDERFISPLTGKVITVATWATEDDCKHTAFALRAMKNSLAYFENLLQIPYPFPKLDLLAVPRFEAGRMENFGLVRATSQHVSLLDHSPRRSLQIVIRARDGLTPPGASLNLFIQVVDMICHEVSHMWFGMLEHS